MTDKRHAPRHPAQSVEPGADETAQLVAEALNEQGYLLHYKVLQELRDAPTIANPPHEWRVEASEVPVSLPNGDETRIDLVLRLGANEGNPWRLVVECKRAARDFKHWVFFGKTAWTRGPSPTEYFIERADLAHGWNNQGEAPLSHRVDRSPASPECPVFDYGVEVKLNRKGHDKKSSATEAIEGAFQQVTLGQTGLSLRLWKACELNYRLLPIVVTTANLVSSEITGELVALDSGMVKASDLHLEPRNWLAVNFRVNDGVCQHSRITTHRGTALADDLAARQVRTVFVVQAAHLQSFLAWLEKVVKAARQ